VYAVLALICVGLPSPTLAYIDLAPTLARILGDAKRVALVEVVQFIPQQRVLDLREVRAIKGEQVAGLVRHELAPGPQAAVPRHILQWAFPGARGVLFVSGKTGLMCIGQGWYQVRSSGGGSWKLGKDRPDLPLAYYGSVSRLVESITAMLDGKDAVVTVVAHGSNNEAASIDLALNRPSLPGLVRIERIRANLKMPPLVLAASGNPAYQIGPGPVDESDLPILVSKLGAADGMERAEAADELRYLGRRAAGAAAPLARLLDDSVPCVRFSAAAALLQIDGDAVRAVEALAHGLESADAAQRAAAARSVGLAGPTAASLSDRLAALLDGNDGSVRIMALQAIAMHGPAAATAVPAVVSLLNERSLAIDAADTLGRIGAAARPALKRLAGMLADEQPAVRWAAVRAMSQIGGDDAHPAVEFMIRALPQATEVEGYNMMIYLALLGPVAKDAIPTIRSVRIKNPVLPSATLWAIESDTTLPWLRGHGFGGPGRGPGPDGPGRHEPDFAILIYESYIHELGSRLRPTARMLAAKLLDGTAGDVPIWGYQILVCNADETIGILAPHLADADLVARERAAVALGYMGQAAAAATGQVDAALGKSVSERERNLLRWCREEIGRP
jgi:HEAT repeat protein